ncbi:hypothetical protein OG884_16865 [Streptosporangium sp. NBC_01755]|uniref:hypothetical protein n=1 Tax=unclassified Streptosporangium TaxID=2632669 RepID=UPI002DDAB622|nr:MULTISPECIES: hypothetical protein [unclassified Streptosporangium]WSA25170.1 hypothetical protein OIE13_30250 [Streptosporangium sp. NBC_01810]WSD03490.1 hypothetical protein OG884_16865 [Streptosporangium sp. NBC_01755]
MARLHDFLGRFRPAGAPGAAAPAGVPADPEAERAAEAAPIFAALADVHTRCREIQVRAERDAEEMLAQAREQATAIVATARGGAGAKRAEAAARARVALDVEGTEVLDAARREAEAIRERAARRMPGEIDRVMGMIRSLAGGR